MSEQQKMEDERYRAELDALLETFAPAVDADVMRTLCAGLGIEFMAVVELYWGEPLRRKRHWSDVAKDGEINSSASEGYGWSKALNENTLDGPSPYKGTGPAPYKFEFEPDHSVFEPKPF